MGHRESTFIGIGVLCKELLPVLSINTGGMWANEYAWCWNGFFSGPLTPDSGSIPHRIRATVHLSKSWTCNHLGSDSRSKAGEKPFQILWRMARWTCGLPWSVSCGCPDYILFKVGILFLLLIQDQRLVTRNSLQPSKKARNCHSVKLFVSRGEALQSKVLFSFSIPVNNTWLPRKAKFISLKTCTSALKGWDPN